MDYTLNNLKLNVGHKPENLDIKYTGKDEELKQKFLKKITGDNKIMEDKLLFLKEQFCNWYCPNRNKVIDYECSGIVTCNECDEEIECDKVQQIYVDLCEKCQIKEFIKFSRDELGSENK